MTEGSICQIEYVNVNSYIGLSSIWGDPTSSASFFLMNTWSTSSNWQYRLTVTSAYAGPPLFIIIPDLYSFVSLWCPVGCALGMANYSTGNSISLSSIPNGVSWNYLSRLRY